MRLASLCCLPRGTSRKTPPEKLANNGAFPVLPEPTAGEEEVAGDWRDRLAGGEGHVPRIGPSETYQK